jgi:hypothetical protein
MNDWIRDASIIAWTSILLATSGCAGQCDDDGLRQRCPAAHDLAGSSSGDPGVTGTSSARPSTTAADGDGSADSSGGTGGPGPTSADGTSDDGNPSDGTYCADRDRDGFGDPSDCTQVAEGAAPPDSTVANGDDCDDGNPLTHPGAAQHEPAGACMKDDDDDGYGDEHPPSNVEPGRDCEDEDDDAFPGAATAEAHLCAIDGDGDGYGDATVDDGVDAGSDCSDNDPTTYPGAAYNDSSTACMRDRDGDGYGDDDPPNAITAGSDCDDFDAQLYTGCMPCPAGQNFCEGDDVAACNDNGTHWEPVESCSHGCNDAAPACWPALSVAAHPSSCINASWGEQVFLDSTVTGGDGDYDYDWSPSTELSDDDDADPSATPTSSRVYTLDVEDGEGNTASDTVRVHLDDQWNLEGGCTLRSWPIGLFGDPAMTYSEGGTVACVLTTARPAVIVCRDEPEDTLIHGRISTPSQGDGSVGFVWGWQDRSRFYLFSWTRADGIVTEAGVTIKRVDADDPEAITLEDLQAPYDTDDSELLLDPEDVTQDGWLPSQTYEVTILHGSDASIVTVHRNGETEFSVEVDDGQYATGRAGPYTYLQAEVCYSAWNSGCP